MQYKFLLFLWMCFCISLYSEAKLEFSQDFTEKKLYWVIKGEVDVPDNSMVSLYLTFGDNMLSRSNKVLYVREGKFIYKYQIKASKILPGKYSAILVYNQNQEKKQLSHLFLIDAHLEAKSKLEYREFFRRSIAEIKNFNKEMKEQAQEHLNKSNQDKAILWVKSLQRNIAEWKEKLTKHVYPETLMPYSQENMSRLQRILTYSHSLSKHYSAEILLHFKLIKNNKELLSEKQISSYETNISTLMDEIEKAENFPKYLNEEILMEDLKWFQSIFVDVSKAYEANSNQFSKQVWDQIYTVFKEQLKIFSKRVDEYRNSPLNRKYPKLNSNLLKLTSSLEKMVDSYTKTLYEKRGIPHNIVVKENLTDIQDEIKDHFAKVYEIVEKHFNTEEKAKVDLVELMVETLSEISDVQKELKEGYTLYIQQKQSEALDEEELLKWQNEWQKKFKKLQANLVSIYHKRKTKILDNFPMNWLFFISYMQTIEKHYIKALNGDQEIEIVTKINTYHVKIDNEINNLKKRINNLK